MRGQVLLTLRPQPRQQHDDWGSEPVSVLSWTLRVAGVWESDAVGGENKYGDVCHDMSSCERFVWSDEEGCWRCRMRSRDEKIMQKKKTFQDQNQRLGEEETRLDPRCSQGTPEGKLKRILESTPQSGVKEEILPQGRYHSTS